MKFRKGRGALTTIVLILIVVIAFGIAGCGGNSGGASSNETDNTVSASEITTVETTSVTRPGELASPMIGYCNGDGVLVRNDPGTATGVGVGGLQFGEMVTVIGKIGDWYQLQPHPNWGGGVDVYVSAQFIQFTIPVSTAPNTAEVTVP